jgi:hypothetical protein
LTNLSFETDDPDAGLNGWIQQIMLQNLTALRSLSFPSVWTMPGELILDDLPSLETVHLSTLRIVRDIRLKKLPKLQTFLVSPDVFGVSGDIEVKDVKINSIDGLFRIGLHAQHISVDGIPNVKYLDYSLFQSENVSIHGNGDLEFTFDCTSCTAITNVARQETITSITTSGISVLRRNHTEGGQISNLIVGTLNMTQNMFTNLPIDFTNLTNLYIIDNPNLTTLSYNNNFTDYGWKDIIISGNPNLKLNSTVERSETFFTPSLSSTWVWPSKDMSNMTFDGLFDNAFL